MHGRAHGTHQPFSSSVRPPPPQRSWRVYYGFLADLITSLEEPLAAGHSPSRHAQQVALSDCHVGSPISGEINRYLQRANARSSRCCPARELRQSLASNLRSTEVLEGAQSEPCSTVPRPMRRWSHAGANFMSLNLHGKSVCQLLETSDESRSALRPNTRPVFTRRTQARAPRQWAAPIPMSLALIRVPA